MEERKDQCRKKREREISDRNTSFPTLDERFTCSSIKIPQEEIEEKERTVTRKKRTKEKDERQQKNHRNGIKLV